MNASIAVSPRGTAETSQAMPTPQKTLLYTPMAKAERHHYVPKSYLKYWTADERSTSETWVRLVRADGITCRMKPSQIAVERGLYDLGAETDFATAVGADFLEKDLFSRRLEPSMVRNMDKFRGPNFKATDSEIDNIVFLGLHLWARNPIAISMALATLFPEGRLNQPTNRTLTTRGDIALATGMAVTSQMRHGMDIHLYGTHGKSRFITSDVPCSMWAKKDGKYLCVKNASHAAGATEGTYLFPLNPTCLIQFAMVGDGKRTISKHIASESDIEFYNSCIAQSANRFCILGHWYLPESS